MRRQLICVALLAVALPPALAAAEAATGGGGPTGWAGAAMKMLGFGEHQIPKHLQVPLLIVAAVIALARYAPGQIASLRENLGRGKANRMALELQRMRLENLKLRYEIEGLKKTHQIDLPEAEAQVADAHTRELELLQTARLKPRPAAKRARMAREQVNNPARRRRFMGRRFLAFLIDSVLVYMFFVLLTGLVLVASPQLDSSETFTTVLGFLFMVAFFLYFPVMWAARGSTLGLMIFGLRVVALDGRALGLKRVTIRLLGFWFLGVLSFLWLAFDNQKQTLHDKLAGTLVVKVRGRLETQEIDLAADVREENELPPEGLSFRAG